MSHSHQLTKFHLYYSELFLLSYAFKNKKLMDSTMVENFNEIINNNIQISRHITEQTLIKLKELELNIDWKEDRNKTNN